MLGKDFIYFVNYTGGGPRASPPAALMKGQDIADTERRSGVRAGTGPAPTLTYSSAWQILGTSY